MNKFIKYSGIILCGTSLFVAAGCSGDMNLGDEQASVTGGLSIDFDISGSPLTRGSAYSPGEPDYNENSISEIDLFFYASDAAEDEKSVYHYHDGNGEVTTVNISFDDLPESIKGDTGFKIYAVLNLKNALGNTSSSADANQKTFAELKSQITSAEPLGTKDSNHRSFKAPDAPEVFVMTNLAQTDKKNTGHVDEENGTKVTISLKRVASKIRVALAIDDEITDDDGTWTPDYSNIRLYMSNGVRKARLDGDVSKLALVDDTNPAKSDYFNIITSGNKGDGNSDFVYARAITKPKDGNKLTGELDEVYTFYNELPHYTYPSSWSENLTETHQPMLTIVIPWEMTDEDGNITYEPTYYTVPVNTKGETVSNAYYYIRAHIGMKGSATPEASMPVDIECEVLDWGTAAQTDVELKPIRYLILNQKEFTINNKTEWTVPFNSTHPCSIVDCKVWVYGYNDYESAGEELKIVIDDNTRYGTSDSSPLAKDDTLYDYSINNVDNTFSFTHHLFEGKFYLAKNTRSSLQGRRNFFNPDLTIGNGSDVPRNKYYNQQVTETFADGSTRKYVRKNYIYTGTQKLYSRFDVEITLQHSDQPTNTPYKETVILHFYPNIYITSDAINSSGGLNSHDGWILVNGYGTSAVDTGGLKQVSAEEGSSYRNRSLTTFTVTTLDESDKEEHGWVIDDPRTVYINNELSDASMTDVADNTTRWSYSYGGPYDGTSSSGGSGTNRHRYGSGLNTMWEYFEGPKPWMIDWSQGVWDVSTDVWSNNQNLEDGSPNPQYHRTLNYYYPANEAQDRGNIIAPKFTVVSYHAYALNSGSGSGGDKERARRRCAAYQQWGYPAGRWRLPTHAEIKFVKQLQSSSVILDVFLNENWCAQGITDDDGDLTSQGNSGSSYVRCVYDNWYWEQVDANGTSYNRIPDPDGTHANWKKFHWGDRPKENPLSDNSDDTPTVENFIRKATNNK